jgi:hypothetical protein
MKRDQRSNKHKPFVEQEEFSSVPGFSLYRFRLSKNIKNLISVANGKNTKVPYLETP